MEALWLASRLEEGRSIESIAREAGRSASTVGYWVNKHGLASQHAPKHAARGGIAREELEALVARGLSVRRMAEQLGVSYTTVRHWLKRGGRCVACGYDRSAAALQFHHLDPAERPLASPKRA